MGELWTLNNFDLENKFSVEVNFILFGVWGITSFEEITTFVLLLQVSNIFIAKTIFLKF